MKSNLPFNTLDVPSGTYLIRIFLLLNRMNPYKGESPGSFAAASRISSLPLLPLHKNSTSSREAYLIQNLTPTSMPRVSQGTLLSEFNIQSNGQTNHPPGSKHAFSKASISCGESNPFSDMISPNSANGRLFRSGKQINVNVWCCCRCRCRRYGLLFFRRGGYQQYFLLELGLLRGRFGLAAEGEQNESSAERVGSRMSSI